MKTSGRPRHYLEVSGQLHAPTVLLQGKSSRYPLDRSLGGPHSRSGRCEEEKLLDPTGTRTPTPRSSPLNVFIIKLLISCLYWLIYLFLHQLTTLSDSTPVLKTEFNGRGDPLRWPRDTLYPQKLALTSPTSGGRSIGIVRLRTKSHGVFILVRL
jgi:hypothetical protein